MFFWELNMKFFKFGLVNYLSFYAASANGVSNSLKQDDNKQKTCNMNQGECSGSTKTVCEYDAQKYSDYSKQQLLEWNMENLYIYTNFHTQSFFKASSRAVDKFSKQLVHVIELVINSSIDFKFSQDVETNFNDPKVVNHIKLQLQKSTKTRLGKYIVANDCMMKENKAILKTYQEEVQNFSVELTEKWTEDYIKQNYDVFNLKEVVKISFDNGKFFLESNDDNVLHLQFTLDNIFEDFLSDTSAGMNSLNSETFAKLNNVQQKVYKDLNIPQPKLTY